MNINLKNTYVDLLPNIFYTKVKADFIENPKLVIFNEKLLKNFNIDSKDINSENIEMLKKEGNQYFSGNKLFQNSKPISQAYAGHQFGYFTMLGDGRAILLGEIEVSNNNDKKIYDIQLKGSGKTPYSRRGDGKAVLGPMLREYIISEAMYNLNIPTTRSLAVVETGEVVQRKYEEKGAILTRIASSHIRVGTFEYASKFGNYEDLKKLADYTINRHFPEILENEILKNSNKKYLEFLKKVINLQAKLISKWSLIGFIHGVMNTDNMTISGETIDYGPCAFMDLYHPNTVFSSIDTQGRYSYGNQPYIGLWNLTIFAESLYPLFEYTFENKEENIDSEEAKIIIQHELLEYNKLYTKYWVEGMRRKLGLAMIKEDDENICKELLEIMKKYKADYTNVFVSLTKNQYNEEDTINGDFYKSSEFINWKKKWRFRLLEEKRSESEIKKLMQKNNPIVIPRNHIVEEILISCEQNDYKSLEKFMEIMENCYNYDKEIEEKYLIPKITKIPYQTYCGT